MGRLQSSLHVLTATGRGARRGVFTGLSLGALVGLVATPATAGEPDALYEDGEDSPEIYGGTPANSCGWPTTVYLGGCTGTLVHPQVVVYAAHCGTGINAVGFGEDGDSLSRTVSTDYCLTNPSYGGASGGKDHAFCVLSQPVTDVPIVPILMGCETSVLQAGKEVTIVGFGSADAQPSYGLKREVTTTINAVGVEAYIGGNGKDSCQGDSGGPVYVQLPDGEHGGAWRVFGITSYGGACGGGGYYSMMHLGMEWMQSELDGDGIDITPCHTADGTWDPGPECGFFPEDPQTGGGSWSSGCGGGSVGGYSATCGVGFNADPDDTAPVVDIVSPADGTTYTTDGSSPATVTVTAEADDGDGWGIAGVELYINGDLIDTDPSAPYEWELNFPSGPYLIEAIAVDRADNVSQPDSIGIGVDTEPPDVPSDDDGDGDGDGSGSGDDGGGDGNGGGDDDGLDSSTSFGLDDDGGDDGCACDVDEHGSGGRSGVALTLLAGLGLLGLRRRRRATS